MAPRKLLAVAVATAALLSLTACGGPDYGVVHDKDHTSAYTYMQCIAQPKGGCIMIPQYVPESWSLDIYLGNDHGWRDVDQRTYDSVKVGDSIDLREDGK